NVVVRLLAHSSIGFKSSFYLMVQDPGGVLLANNEAAVPWHDTRDRHSMRTIRRGRNDASGDKHMTWQLDANSMSALLDARETTPLELLNQALARLDALEP